MKNILLFFKRFTYTIMLIVITFSSLVYLMNNTNGGFEKYNETSLFWISLIIGSIHHACLIYLDEYK